MLNSKMMKLVVAFIIAEKARGRGEEVRCLCYERQRNLEIIKTIKIVVNSESGFVPLIFPP